MRGYYLIRCFVLQSSECLYFLHLYYISYLYEKNKLATNDSLLQCAEHCDKFQGYLLSMDNIECQLHY